MRGLQADSVYVSILLAIALTIAGVWSMRDGGHGRECRGDCDAELGVARVDTDLSGNN